MSRREFPTKVKVAAFKRAKGPLRGLHRAERAEQSPTATISYACPEDADESERDHVRRVFDRRRKRMERVDGMPPALRALVHEYGLSVVDAFMDQGLTEPRIIRHLINVVLAGSINGDITGKVKFFESHSGRAA